MLSRLSWLLSRLLGRSNPGLNRSKLVGMYLDRTNSNNAYSTEMQRTRQRRNGKFSTHRERL